MRRPHSKRFKGETSPKHAVPRRGPLKYDPESFTLLIWPLAFITVKSVPVGFEQRIPLLKEEGWLRHKEKEPVPKWRRRGGQER